MVYNKAIKTIAFLTMAMLTLFVGCKKEAPQTQVPAPTPTYQLNVTSATLFLDETYDLVVTGNDGTKQVLWESTNPRIATVSSTGKVTAISQGYATVSATVDGVTLTCAINVLIRQDGIAFIDLLNEVKTDGRYVFNLPVGDEYTLEPVLVAGMQIEGLQFILSCANSNVSVSGTTIKATAEVSNVEVKITCDYENAEYSLSVFINSVQVEG